jgi:hypothetical protein
MIHKYLHVYGLAQVIILTRLMISTTIPLLPMPPTALLNIMDHKLGALSSSRNFFLFFPRHQPFCVGCVAACRAWVGAAVSNPTKRVKN